ncbi:MAG: ThuA domain-containing protein [Planctomycetota bacterium]
MQFPRSVRVLAVVLLPFWVSMLQAADKSREGKIQTLVVTGGHGYEKPAFEAMFDAMPDVAASHVTYPAAAEKLKPELAEEYDAIVFYDMWARGISPDQQKAFLELLNRGIGVVALHHTMAAHQDWPEYKKIIGGRYYLQERKVDGKVLPKSGYRHGQDIPVHVANPDHPITEGMKDFTIHDETYSNYYTDPAATVLLTTEHPKSDRELAWTKTYANSKVVYIELGHDHFAYEHPSYRKLLSRSIRYVAGRPVDSPTATRELFNGKDLSGWTAEGNAIWEVKDGLLIGRQGKDNAPGDLFTEESFDDFELSVTYRVVWPANSGVWYRYQSGVKAFQADILEYKNPFALSGSLYRPGKGGPFIAINTDNGIIDRDGWNTLVNRAVDDRHVIRLNGEKTADVRDDLSSSGKIGFQVHAGDQFGEMRIIVREVVVRPL